VLEDALRFSAASHTRHGVTIERDLEEVGPFTADRNRLFQVVMNLLRNATQAVQARAGERRIRVRLRGAQQRLSIEVADNGSGIAPENLLKIFNLGFTTKQGGHGFGLHSSAIAATEMGGALTAKSDGPGLGATFTLELPIEHHAAGAP
jgi:C4-dicarboxylate-specific signal transduction histidine kinase